MVNPPKNIAVIIVKPINVMKFIRPLLRKRLKNNEHRIMNIAVDRNPINIDKRLILSFNLCIIFFSYERNGLPQLLQKIELSFVVDPQLGQNVFSLVIR